jgi:hypothetical protein
MRASQKIPEAHMKLTAFFAAVFCLASNAQASHLCARKAVETAKENSRGSTLVALEQIDAGKSYLVGYDVAIKNRSEGSVEEFRIILMSSDCSVVSVTPAL